MSHIKICRGVLYNIKVLYGCHITRGRHMATVQEKADMAGNALSAVSLRRESGQGCWFSIEEWCTLAKDWERRTPPISAICFPVRRTWTTASALIPSFSCRKRKMDGAIRMRTPVKERLLGTTHRVYGAAFCLTITVTALPDHPASALQLCRLDWGFGKNFGSCFPLQKGG